MEIAYKYRFLNWLIAFAGGYFWLPCPICGKNFGGHESTGTLMITHSEGQGVCPMCIKKADRMNKRFFEENPMPPMRLPF